ncbi:MAG: nucleotide exchange factor GrpE [Acidobacteria bacterium]|nr:nucleotide exchange factor GrpE [Acidobacteriota bacterium]
MTDDALEQKDGTTPTDVPASADATDAARERTLQEERDQFYDLLLRKTAEFENYRKRIDRERREQADRVAADVLQDLLPIVDDLELALKADSGGEGAGAYRKGVELIHKQLVELLKKRGVRAIDALGADFDPHVHQAVTTETIEGRRDGEVIEEYRRGYLIGERLLRPAMVKVARS